MSDSRALPYRSEPLAALLSVFARWGSSEFITALSRHSGHDLDPTSIVAMTVLAREGAIRPSVLAEQLRVGASNVSKITNRLVDARLAERLPDPGDARATLVRLSVEGTDLMNSLVVAGDDMMARTLAEWPESDRAEFARLLLRFERDTARFASVIQNPTE